MTPADVLDAAADLIERDGWWNGGNFSIFDDDPVPSCAITAMWHASNRDARTRLAAEDAVLTHIGPAYERVQDWNDAQDGPDKVIWTMRQVAADLREGGG